MCAARAAGHPTPEPSPQQDSGRALGWLSGLGMLVVPGLAAGVLATIATMVGPERWDAESTFPWLLLATGSVGLAWLVYGSARIRGFRHGAVRGATIALTVVVTGYLLVRLLQG